MESSGPTGMPGEPPGPRCACGHSKTAHKHYRTGTDCSLCDCPRFRRGLLRRFLRSR